MFKELSSDWEKFEAETITNFFSSLELKVSESKSEVGTVHSYKIPSFVTLEETDFCKSSQDTIFQDLNYTTYVDSFPKPKPVSPPPPNRISGKWLPGNNGKTNFCFICKRQLGSQIAYSRHLLSEFHFKQSANSLALRSNTIKNTRKCKYRINSYLDMHNGCEITPNESSLSFKPGISYKPRLKKRSESKHKKLDCPICNKKCLSKSNLGKHCLITHLYESTTVNEIWSLMEEIIPHSPFTCCGFYFNTENDILNHFSSSYHMSMGKPRCNICRFFCNNWRTMEGHLSSVKHQCRYRRTESFTDKVCSPTNDKDLFSTGINSIVSVETGDGKLELENYCDKSVQTDELDTGTASGVTSVGCIDMNTSVCLSNSTEKSCVETVTNSKMSDKSNSKKLTCHHCTVVCASIQDLRNHCQKNHELDYLNCDYCFQKLFYLDVKKHLKECKLLEVCKKYTCLACNAKFASNSECLLHEALQHHQIYSDNQQDLKKRKMKCPVCNKNYFRSNLKNHIITHGQEKYYNCQYCNQVFFTRMECLAHAKKNHYVESHMQPLCVICGKLCSTWKKLKIHKRLHGRERSFLCDTCGKMFITKGNLETHQKEHEGIIIRCPTENCHYVAKSKSQLWSHVNRVHNTLTPSTCDTCGLSFKSKPVLMKHIHRIHNRGKNRHKCGECSYTSYSLFHVRRHMRKHTHIRPYKCPHCHYACSTLDNLKKHIVRSTQHPGQALFKCLFEQCSFTTNSVSQYRKHCGKDHAQYLANDSCVAQMCGIFDPKSEREFYVTVQILRVPEYGRP